MALLIASRVCAFHGLPPRAPPPLCRPRAPQSGPAPPRPGRVWVAGGGLSVRRPGWPASAAGTRRRSGGGRRAPTARQSRRAAPGSFDGVARGPSGPRRTTSPNRSDLARTGPGSARGRPRVPNGPNPGCWQVHGRGRCSCEVRVQRAARCTEETGSDLHVRRGCDRGAETRWTGVGSIACHPTSAKHRQVYLHSNPQRVSSRIIATFLVKTRHGHVVCHAGPQHLSSHSAVGCRPGAATARRR